MIKHKPWVDGVYRIRGEKESRLSQLRLDKNERVDSLPPWFVESLRRRIESDLLTAYPETEQLYERLAARLNIDSSCLVVTAGSDAAIRHAFELCVNPRDKVIVLDPTFAMVEVFCGLFGAQRIAVQYDGDLKLRVDDLLAQIDNSISLIVLANPNSPTGTCLTNKELEPILEKSSRHRIPVLIDEAYNGFCQYTALPLLDAYPNLIIARTFSKAAGIAGLRIGYVVAREEVAQLLYRFRPMYEVNSVAVAAALEILDHPEIVSDYLAETALGKSLLLEYLRKRGIRFVDTSTNFIHVGCPGFRERVLSEFQRRHVLVHGGLPVPGYEDYIRVTIGPPPAMRTVIEVLKSAVPK